MPGNAIVAATEEMLTTAPPWPAGQWPCFKVLGGIVTVSWRMMVLKGSLRTAGCRTGSRSVFWPGFSRRSWWMRQWTRPGPGDRGGGVAAGGGRRWKPPNISSLSRGRGKLGPAPVRFLFEQVAGPIGEEGAPGVFCCGLRVVSMDGSTSDVPDEAPNDEHFGRPSNQARDGAFPQVRWLAAAESGTGSLLGASMGPYRDSEQALARDLLDQGCFGPGMVVLADRKFLSWALAREFLATGAHILWRASASFTLKPVKVLPDGTYLAELTPPRKKDGPPLTVRVIEYTVHTTPEDGGDKQTSELFCLVTDL